MSKIRILVMDVENAGVGKFRFRDPHTLLQKNYRNEFHIDIIQSPPIHDMNFCSKYDMFFLQGSLLLNENLFKLLEKIKLGGMKIVVDLDDYWRLPSTHAMYKDMEKKWSSLTKRLAIADLITTTTVALAKAISKYNKNVKVIPNAVNPDEEQFQTKTLDSERIRISYSAGSSHLEDVKLLRGVFGKLQQISTPSQMVLCGFNNQVKDLTTGKIETVKLPKVWIDYERIFTNEYSLPEDYKRFLLNPRDAEFPNIEDMPYRRIWTKDFHEYAQCYNHTDIALAPLVDNEFNVMKSQLKVIEAGFHKKPMVVSDISPYNIDCRNLINAMIVRENKKHKEWFDHIKLLVESPALREDMGLALYETVKEKYNLHNVCKIRRQIYQNLVKNEH